MTHQREINGNQPKTEHTCPFCGHETKRLPEHLRRCEAKP